MMMLEDVNGFGHLLLLMIQTSAQVPFRRDVRDTR
jgi:hypothetical protein